MKQKVLLALIVGTIAYTVIVISGILMELSLQMILFKSITGLIVITAGSFLLLYIMENTALEEQEQFEADSFKQEIEEKQTEIEVKKEFSPLEVPVVETIDSSDTGD